MTDDMSISASQTAANLIKQSTTWGIILGGLMIGLGLAAISLPLMTSLALAIWIGWLLVVNSVIKALYAVQTRQDGSVGVKLLLALLYLLAGGLLIINPLEGVLTLTLLLGVFLISEGVVELILAIRLRSLANWGWLLFNAVITLLLGGIVWAEWPLDAPWVVGLVVGISFITSGLSRVMLSLAVRSVANRITQEAEATS